MNIKVQGGPFCQFPFWWFYTTMKVINPVANWQNAPLSSEQKANFKATKAVTYNERPEMKRDT